MALPAVLSRGLPTVVLALWLALALLGVALPVIVALRLVVDAGASAPPSVVGLFAHFDRRGYDVVSVRFGNGEVPRIFVAALPSDWGEIEAPEARKRAFIMTLLPLVLRENEIVLAERARLEALRHKRLQGTAPTKREMAWLTRLASDYGLAGPDLDILLLRIDAVPPSLVLAQAAIESGWGTSRFALEGNALFGEWTEEDRNGIVPAERAAGRTYAIRAFSSLGRSVAAYLRNLNRHRAYDGFRRARAELRRRGARVSGLELAKELRAYSQRGAAYVRDIQEIIGRNGLAQFDTARLRGRAS